MNLSLSALAAPAAIARPKIYLAVLLALGLSHLLNNTIKSLIPAVYPVLKNQFALDFVQIGRRPDSHHHSPAIKRRKFASGIATPNDVKPQSKGERGERLTSMMRIRNFRWVRHSTSWRLSPLRRHQSRLLGL